MRSGRVATDFALAPANEPEREVVAAMLDRQPLAAGQVLVADQGFVGRDFERLVRDQGTVLVRPDRAGELPRFGTLGRMRQWVESVFDTIKGQLGLERHGGRTLDGLLSRVTARLLALAASIWHNWQIGSSGRHLTAYDH